MATAALQVWCLAAPRRPANARQTGLKRLTDLRRLVRLIPDECEYRVSRLIAAQISPQDPE
jgi:hypothetical protein